MNRIEIFASIVASVVTIGIVQTVSQNNPSANPLQPTPPAPSTPISTETVVCPHPTQNPIIPMGRQDPECVYRLGTIGNQIRIDYSDLYLSTRQQMRLDGSSLQETEAELYRLDLEILGRAMKEGRKVQGT